MNLLRNTFANLNCATHQMKANEFAHFFLCTCPLGSKDEPASCSQQPLKPLLSLSQAQPRADALADVHATSRIPSPAQGGTHLPHRCCWPTPPPNCKMCAHTPSTLAQARLTSHVQTFFFSREPPRITFFVKCQLHIYHFQSFYFSLNINCFWLLLYHFKYSAMAQWHILQILRLCQLQMVQLGSNPLTELPEALGHLQALGNLLTWLSRGCLCCTKRASTWNREYEPPNGKIWKGPARASFGKRQTADPSGEHRHSFVPCMVLEWNYLIFTSDVVGDLPEISQLYLASNKLTALPSSFSMAKLQKYLWPKIWRR